MKKQTFLISMILFVVIMENLVKGQELLYKAFARSQRASRGPDDFEKFFLKASKSVPRIGRRNFNMGEFYGKENLKGNSYIKSYPFLATDYGSDSTLNDIPWNDLADKIEYYPEVLMSPGFLARTGFRNINNDGVMDEDKRQDNLQKPEQNKEITEYRLQPDS